MARENEKVVGTRLSEVDQEALELLAVFHDQTVGALLRTAVREFIEKEQRNIHPLSLEAAVSLAASLGTIDTNTIFDSASHLTKASYGDAGGVYLLVHQETRELYVGSSTELQARLTHHKFSIKTGTHKNQSLNGWLVDDVVVVILESCDGVKNAAGKKALLEREQFYINTLMLSKDWTLLNMVVASTGSSSSGRKSSQGIVSPPPSTKETPSKNIPGVSTTTAAAPITPALTTSTNSVNVTAFEQFYSTVIEQSLIPVLDEQKSSRDVVRLYEGCEDEQEKRWFLEFLGSYNSQWLVSLAASGKFPWISKLMEQVEAQK